MGESKTDSISNDRFPVAYCGGLNSNLAFFPIPFYIVRLVFIRREIPRRSFLPLNVFLFSFTLIIFKPFIQAGKTSKATKQLANGIVINYTILL